LEDVFAILNDQLDTVLYNNQFPKALLWKLSEKDNDISKISASRELISTKLFQLIESNAKFRNVDLPAGIVLQLAGIYFLGLFAKIKGECFLGLDISTAEERSRIERSLRITLEELSKRKIKKNR